MRYEYINDLEIPKIGFGTWRIGGRAKPDPASDHTSRQALRSAFELRYTHFDTAETYAGGHTEELLGKVMREMEIPRETLFITSKVSPENLRYEDVLRSCENSLRRLGTHYLDLYLIHWPGQGIPLIETFKGLNQLVEEGKVRALGVSNFDLQLLQQSMELSKTPLLTNQVSYSLSDRTCQKNGVLKYCQENDLLLTAYSPVKHRDGKKIEVLKKIATSYDATVEQIELAWLTTQIHVITIPMSTNPKHQADNIAAADIVLTQEEMDLLG